MFVTASTFQFGMSPLKLVASRNMKLMSVTDFVFQRRKSALKPSFSVNMLCMLVTSPTFQLAMPTVPSTHAAFTVVDELQHASTALFSVSAELKYPSTAEPPPDGTSPASTARARPASATTHAPPTIVASIEGFAILAPRFFFAPPSRVAIARSIARVPRPSRPVASSSPSSSPSSPSSSRASSVASRRRAGGKVLRDRTCARARVSALVEGRISINIRYQTS